MEYIFIHIDSFETSCLWFVVFVVWGQSTFHNNYYILYIFYIYCIYFSYKNRFDFSDTYLYLSDTQFLIRLFCKFYLHMLETFVFTNQGEEDLCILGYTCGFLGFGLPSCLPLIVIVCCGLEILFWRRRYLLLILRFSNFLVEEKITTNSINF